MKWTLSCFFWCHWFHHLTIDKSDWTTWEDHSTFSNWLENNIFVKMMMIKTILIWRCTLKSGEVNLGKRNTFWKVWLQLQVLLALIYNSLSEVGKVHISLTTILFVVEVLFLTTTPRLSTLLIALVEELLLASIQTSMLTLICLQLFHVSMIKQA